MKLSLCPRCELNYITENEQYCKVCLREMHGDTAQDEVELCSICNEAPVMPGRDVCMFCLKEMSQQPEGDEQEQEEGVDTSAIAGMDSVAQMDEIIPDVNEGIPGDLENALSLESVREEEEKQADEEDSEDDEI